MKVAVTSKAFSKNETLISELKQHFSDVKLNLTGRLLEGDELYEFLADRDGAIVAMEQIVPPVLDRLPNLKVIAKFGVGLNNLDLDYCAENGVDVRWTSGVNKGSVAEMTVGFMLMLIRNLYMTSSQLSQGTWNKNGGQSLYGKTIGIIGLGHIGQEVVRLLQPFNCRILVNDILSETQEHIAFHKQYQLQAVDKQTLFEQADIVTIHTPLTDETRAIINQNVLSMMGKHAFLINTARGELVDLHALKEALEQGGIAGAAIDVYDQEPPQHKELLAMHNLICTPHIGGNSKEATLAMGRSAIGHLVDYYQHTSSHVD